jgi:hypothetical protein
MVIMKIDWIKTRDASVSLLILLCFAVIVCGATAFEEQFHVWYVIIPCCLLVSICMTFVIFGSIAWVFAFLS